MIFQEGTNCWRCSRSDKVSFLVDGADYFEVLVRALRQARETVYITGWDMDARLVLDRREAFKIRIPPLGDFLNLLAEANESLRIHILLWDMPMMFTPRNHWLPNIYKKWKPHKRVRIHLDSEHPISAAHHEKIVVIDDSIAFCGGLDLTSRRWDTQEHRLADPRRIDPDGETYHPVHDVQMAVDGETARILGIAFRQRWQCAAGDVLSPPRVDSVDRWPRGLDIDISTPCRVAVVRTQPPYKDQVGVQEMVQLYSDMIRAARHLIYIENQYLTVDQICRELGRRLVEEAGPEIILVMPRRANSWLEQSTMDAIRSHHLQQLAKQDRQGRLAAYYPFTGNIHSPVYIHAKLMIVDDRMAVIGSANLSNRSMGLDTECGLAVAGDVGSSVQSAITDFRRRLLAEHLGVTPGQIAAAEQGTSFLRQAIASLQSPERGLALLDGDVQPEMDLTDWVPDPSYLDPKEPFMLDRMMDLFSREHRDRKDFGPLMKIITVLVLLLALTAIWQWTPLNQWITVEHLARWAGMAGDRPLVILAIIGGFALGGLIFVPVTLMIGATALILPPWQSFGCALTGVLLNGTVTYLLGRHLKKTTIQRMMGPRIERLQKYLARRGILTVVVVRNLPIAPFTMVNIVAGAGGIQFSHFLIGTAAGMLPGIAAITLFTSRALQVIRNPSLINIAVAVVIALLIALGLWWLRRRMQRNSV